MLIKSTKFFISSIFGNVDPGQILDADDRRAKLLIDNGLAVAYASPLNVEEESSSSFQQPAGSQAEPGQSSQAAPVSQKKTAKVSGFGGKKTKTIKKETS